MISLSLINSMKYYYTLTIYNSNDTVHQHGITLYTALSNTYIARFISHNQFNFRFKPIGFGRVLKIIFFFTYPTIGTVTVSEPFVSSLLSFFPTIKNGIFSVTTAPSKKCCPMSISALPSCHSQQKYGSIRQLVQHKNHKKSVLRPTSFTSIFPNSFPTKSPTISP